MFQAARLLNLQQEKRKYAHHLRNLWVYVHCKRGRFKEEMEETDSRVFGTGEPALDKRFSRGDRRGTGERRRDITSYRPWTKGHRVFI